MRIPVLHITVNAAQPVYLRMVGRHPHRRDVVYFDRTYSQVNGKFRGTKTFEFPLPVVTKAGVKVQLSDALTGSRYGLSILAERVSTRAVRGLTGMDEHLTSFIRFASWFSQECGALDEGQYQSKDGEHLIWLRNQIRSHETGQRLATPARVHLESGQVEVSKEDFLPLTVVNRLSILCHEYYHVLGDTLNEADCDRFAIDTCLRLGFSKTECFYTLSRLHDLKGLSEESKKAIEHRVIRARNMIQMHNG